MRLYAYLAIALALLGAGFGGGWNVRAWKSDADNADRIKREIAQAQANQYTANSASSRYEGDKAVREMQTKVITKEVIRVVQSDPVYLSECVSPDGLRLVARALGAASSASEPSPAMPAASAPN